jgi:hypothetical protein
MKVAARAMREKPVPLRNRDTPLRLLAGKRAVRQPSADTLGTA